MIQRIQSLFLLLAAIGATGAAFLPQVLTTNTYTTGVLSDNRLDGQDDPLLLGLWLVAALLALIAIFLFRNRKTQLFASVLYILVVLGAVGFGVYLLMPLDSIEGLLPGAGLFLGLAGIIFIVLARIYIRKDDKLVKSMDRLR